MPPLTAMLIQYPFLLAKGGRWQWGEHCIFQVKTMYLEDEGRIRDRQGMVLSHAGKGDGWCYRMLGMVWGTLNSDTPSREVMSAANPSVA